jgi:hypothetical protein
MKLKGSYLKLLNENLHKLIYILKLVCKWDRRRVDWIGQAQDRDRWQNLVNAVMKLRVP